MAKEIYYLRSNTGLIFRAYGISSSLYPQKVYVDVWHGSGWFAYSALESWEKWEQYAVESEKVVAIVREKEKQRYFLIKNAPYVYRVYECYHLNRINTVVEALTEGGKWYPLQMWGVSYREWLRDNDYPIVGFINKKEKLST